MDSRAAVDQHDAEPVRSTPVVARRGRVTIVQPLHPRLDIEVAPELRAALARVVRSGCQRLVIDLSAVTFVDSSGLGALISALKMVKTSRERRRMPRPEPARRPASRGDVRLANVPPGVMALLQIIRLDRVFSSFPTVDSAVASFGETAP